MDYNPNRYASSPTDCEYVCNDKCIAEQKLQTYTSGTGRNRTRKTRWVTENVCYNVDPKKVKISQILTFSAVLAVIVFITILVLGIYAYKKRNTPIKKSL